MTAADGHDQHVTLQGSDGLPVDSHQLIQVTVVWELVLARLQVGDDLCPRWQLAGLGGVVRGGDIRVWRRECLFRLPQLIQSLLSGLDIILQTLYV